MADKYAELWERAKPYLDTRDNETHTLVSLNFARRLLAHYPEADPDVVLPAVILHDLGWKMIPEDQHLQAYGPKMKDADLRRTHEQESVRLARGILEAVDYDSARREEILAIIDGHDSRETALSLNDQLMKDSDKLWRFTRTAIEIYRPQFQIELREYLPWLGRQIEGWMFTPEAARIARETLAEAQAALLGEG